MLTYQLVCLVAVGLWVYLEGCSFTTNYLIRKYQYDVVGPDGKVKWWVVLALVLWPVSLPSMRLYQIFRDHRDRLLKDKISRLLRKNRR